jgi:hypothetical protein
VQLASSEAANAFSVHAVQDPAAVVEAPERREVPSTFLPQTVCSSHDPLPDEDLYVPGAQGRHVFPSLEKPALQRQLNPPSVFLQVASAWQSCAPVTHSLMSKQIVPICWYPALHVQSALSEAALAFAVHAQLASVNNPDHSVNLPFRHSLVCTSDLQLSPALTVATSYIVLDSFAPCAVDPQVNPSPLCFPFTSQPNEPSDMV